MKISALDNNGNIKEYNVILTYHNDKYNKDYVVYTDNIYNESDELQIYISEYDPDNLECVVKDISNNKEYNEIKREVNSILLTMKNESDKI